MKTHKSICTRSVALSVCLIGVAVLMLGAALTGCSFSNTTGPTNSGPLSLLRNDIQAAGITSLEGSEGQGELYLRVLPVEGQDPTRLLGIGERRAVGYNEADWFRHHRPSNRDKQHHGYRRGRGYQHR